MKEQGDLNDLCNLLHNCQMRRMKQRDDAFPHYHFRPPTNWINDPNGVIQWNGRYHLFYQHNPFGALWGNMHWGHAVSDDLVHWEHLPLALAPTEGDFDEYGCFSGGIVDNDGVPTMIYTGTQAAPLGAMPYTQHANIATSQDDLTTWQKFAGNPIIRPPHPKTLIGFRDHNVWRNGDHWLHIIGSGVQDVGPTAFLYRSDDLYEWEPLGKLYQNDGLYFGDEFVGSMWECPQLLDFGRKQALIIGASHNDSTVHTSYLIGTMVGDRFHPEAAYRLDYGNRYFYAAQSLIDDMGRTIMWGWIPEARDDELCVAAGWSGVMSLPCVVTLGEDDRLRFAVAEEVRQLRRERFGVEQLSAVQSDCFEIVAEFEGNERVEIGVRVSAENQERTTIFYDPESQTLGIDRSQSRRDGDGHDLSLLTGRISAENRLHLHIFVDASVIEVFANKVAVIIGRVYPDAEGLGVRLKSADAALHQFELWTLDSIWH